MKFILNGKSGNSAGCLIIKKYVIINQNLKEINMKNILGLGILFSVITAGAYGNDSGIFNFKAGQFDVYMLVESERD